MRTANTPKKPENLQLFQDIIDESGYRAYIVSEKLGHNKSTIYAWLKGRYEPNARDMLGLSKLLQVPVETIVRIFGEEA